MPFVLTSLIAVLVVLGIMVLVHEFGHYAVAKLFGVRVEVFSIGFGRRLFGFRKGETDYRISMLPFGGYVKMSGENPMESRTGEAGEFGTHPRWQRILIALAGPAMNILLAVGILTGIYMAHTEHPAFIDQAVTVGYVADGSPAQKAGLRPGDTIVAAGGLQDPTWEQFFLRVPEYVNQPMHLTVLRDGRALNLQITPPDQNFEKLGLMPDEPLIVSTLEPGMPASRAGLHVGDRIVRLNGYAPHTMQEIVGYLQTDKGAPVEVAYMRDGREGRVTLDPVQTDTGGERRWRMGAAFSMPMKVEHLPFTAALARSIEFNKTMSTLIVDMVRKMITHQVSIKSVDGPIGIARASGEAATQPGWIPLLTLMTGISLNLGIFNLFPIPILDGGVILLLLIEGLMQRDLNQQIKERIYQAAFVFLILFTVLVIVNDISKLPMFGGRM